MEELGEKKKKVNIKAMVGMTGGVVIFYLAQHFFFGAQSVDAAMMEAANELNKKCPIMVNKDSRLDNGIALPGHIFQYNYTLVNVIKGEADIEFVKKEWEPTFINNVKSNPNMKRFRDNKVTLVYSYKDKTGIFLFNLELTPEKYLK